MIHQNIIIDYTPNNNDQTLDLADALGNAKCLDSAIEGAGYQVKRIEMGRETISLES